MKEEIKRNNETNLFKIKKMERWSGVDFEINEKKSVLESVIRAAL